MDDLLGRAGELWHGRGDRVQVLAEGQRDRRPEHLAEQGPPDATTHDRPGRRDRAAVGDDPAQLAVLDVEPLLGTRFPLERVHDAFAAAGSRQGVKTLVTP